MPPSLEFKTILPTCHDTCRYVYQCVNTSMQSIMYVCIYIYTTTYIYIYNYIYIYIYTYMMIAFVLSVKLEPAQWHMLVSATRSA